MSTTSAQIAANRANAQLSTGPVTPSGKSMSSRNAAGPIAHSLAAGEEEQQEIDFLIGEYSDTFRPATPVERDLVVDMAVARWRRMRLLQFESSVLANAFNKVAAELGPGATRVQVQATALERLIESSKTWNTLHRYLRDAERTMNNCMKQLAAVRPSQEPAPAPLKQVRKNEPNLPPPAPPQPQPNRFGPNVPLRPNGYPVNLALAL